MTEETETQGNVLEMELDVPFRDRMITVRMPQPEQILVWQRIMRRLQQGANQEQTSAAEVLRLLEQCRQIMDSIVVRQEVIDWFDDEMLAGRMRLKDMIPLFTSAVEAFTEAANAQGNRAQRRSAAKKVTRKKPAKKAAKSTGKGS